MKIEFHENAQLWGVWLNEHMDWAEQIRVQVNKLNCLNPKFDIDMTEC